MHVLIAGMWLFSWGFLENDKKICVNLYSGCPLRQHFFLHSMCVCFGEGEFRSSKDLQQQQKLFFFLQVSNTAAIMESTSLRHCLCWKLDSNLRRITEQIWEVLLDKIGSSYFFEWTVPCLLSRVLNLGNLKEKKKPQRQQSSCF